MTESARIERSEITATARARSRWARRPVVGCLALWVASAIVAASASAQTGSGYVAKDLGTLRGGQSYATAVNASGKVVGIAEVPSNAPPGSEYHAFSWTLATGMIDLGKGQALAVNDSGQIVGQNAQGHACVWSPTGVMTDLGTLGGLWSAATSVNASGQVVGQAYTEAGYGHAFSWPAADGMMDMVASGRRWRSKPAL